MKRIDHFNTARDKLLHIETEGAIVNIRVGLHNTAGQEVTSIEILPDTNGSWRFDGTFNNRVIKGELTDSEIQEDVKEAIANS